ncbi:MAG TPA: DUF2330 domain-containing protein [Flavobacteriales bacterium]|nr:DUF2330 domain-containing protein [Flavobacteriales bacterium]
MRHFFIPAFVLLAQQASAFCGFYIAKADATLFNDRSEIILVRDGQRTILTMSNDFKGDVKDFALVVPVPTILQRDDIKVVERRVFDALDAYSAPRLVEYYDENPCQKWRYADMLDSDASEAPSATSRMNREAKAAKDKGVTIEARYTVGEYDILILSATESTGLKEWLIENGYRIPQTAREVLDPYIKSNLKFFVVKVNLQQLSASGFNTLRPIQIRFESHKFMLPIRLGMANSSGSQDMIVHAFTRTGRVECVNYRTVKVPTDRNIPLFVKERFGPFYKDLFARAHRREGRNTVFLEYAWNVTPSFSGMKCDPCVGPPPMPLEFAQAGADWSQQGAPTFYTRLHVRYARDRFPQDLVFQVTPNTEHFQARYVLTHPAQGELTCSEGQDYLEELYYRRHRELEELNALTGWNVEKHRDYANEVKGKMSPEQLRKMEGPLGMPVKDPGGPGAPLMIAIAAGLVLLLLVLFSRRQLQVA